MASSLSSRVDNLTEGIHKIHVTAVFYVLLNISMSRVI